MMQIRNNPGVINAGNLTTEQVARIVLGLEHGTHGHVLRHPTKPSYRKPDAALDYLNGDELQRAWITLKNNAEVVIPLIEGGLRKGVRYISSLSGQIRAGYTGRMPSEVED